MRENARAAEPTFGLTADSGHSWNQEDVFVNTVGTFGVSLSVLLVEPSLNSSGQTVPAHCCSLRDIVGSPPRRRLPSRDEGFFLCDDVGCPMSW